jgi:hypothetical protein
MDNKSIPTHDPYTGELNPYYEELTGEKNPLLTDNEDDNYCFDLSTLIGKEFRYYGKYGLSTWTDKVKNIEPNMGLHTNFKESLKPVKEGEDRKKFEIFGHSVNLYVRSTRGNHLYELENCVFVNY